LFGTAKFEPLQDARLNAVIIDVFGNRKGAQARANSEALKQIGIALLEADVNFKVPTAL